MFERFTKEARRVLVVAQEEALGLGHNYIGTEHIVLGLLSSSRLRLLVTVPPDDIRAAVLEAVAAFPTAEPVGEEPAEMDAVGRKRLRRIIRSGLAPPFTARAKKTLELSLREALQLGHNYIGTEHLLLGVLREGEGVGAKVLKRVGVTQRDVVQRLHDLPADAPAEPLVGTRYTRGAAAFFQGLSADREDRGPLGTPELLLQLVRDGDSAAGRALMALGVTVEAVEAQLAEIGVEGTSDDPAVTEPIEVKVGGRSLKIDDPETRKKILDLLREHEGDGEADAG